MKMKLVSMMLAVTLATMAVSQDTLIKNPTVIVVDETKVSQSPTPAENELAIPLIRKDDGAAQIAEKLVGWHSAILGFVTILLGYAVKWGRLKMSLEKQYRFRKWTALTIFSVSSAVLIAASVIQKELTLYDAVGSAIIVLSTIGLHGSFIKPLEAVAKIWKK